MCVCVRKREREGGRKGEINKCLLWVGTLLSIFQTWFLLNFASILWSKYYYLPCFTDEENVFQGKVCIPTCTTRSLWDPRFQPQWTWVTPHFLYSPIHTVWTLLKWLLSSFSHEHGNWYFSGWRFRFNHKNKHILLAQKFHSQEFSPGK